MSHSTTSNLADLLARSTPSGRIARLRPFFDRAALASGDDGV